MLKHHVMLLEPHTLYSGGEVGQGRSPADSGFGAMWMDLSWRNPCLSLPWTMCPLPEEDLLSLASPICRLWATAQGTTVPPPTFHSISTRPCSRTSARKMQRSLVVRQSLISASVLWANLPCSSGWSVRRILLRVCLDAHSEMDCHVQRP